jgi:DNA-binding XRE family transcriptional regulator
MMSEADGQVSLAWMQRLSGTWTMIPTETSSTSASMKAQRIFRASGKTDAERTRERALREKFQKEQPSLEDLVRTGACDPDAIMTMGMYFDVQKAIQGLKLERQRCGLTIGDVAKHSGLDRAVVSRLENGKQDNPTVATLMRYAAAVGKRFLWSYEDLPGKATDRDGKARQRRAKRCT